MSYDQIMVMGAGAVGGYFGGRLSERTSAGVTMIARGAHLEAMQRRGLEIKSPEGDVVIDVPAYESPESAEKPDLILFTVKSYDTEAAIRKIESVVTPHTQILTIQNGIENYEKLVGAFGEERVIQGFCRIGASITAPGVIGHRSLGSIVVGEPDGRRSERMQMLEATFAGTGIDFSISGDIQHDVWVKFSWNSIYNMVTGIAMVTVDRLHRFPASRRLCGELFEELRKLAATRGVALTDGDRETILKDSQKLVGFTTSTYNDRSKGKKMEYEAFTGAIVRLAGEEGVDVPHHETLYALLKLIDET